MHERRHLRGHGQDAADRADADLLGQPGHRARSATGNVTTVTVACATQTLHRRRHASPVSPAAGWCCRTTWATTSRSAADGPFTFATAVASGAPVQRHRADAAVVAHPDLHGRGRQRPDPRRAPSRTWRSPAPPTTTRSAAPSSASTGTGLILQNGGGDDLAITANGAFQFATSALSGATRSR